MSRITVHLPDQDRIIDSDPHNSIKDMLLEQGIPLNLPCGGNGSCGKCTVHIKDSSGTQEVLACQTKPSAECEITVPASAILRREAAMLKSMGKDASILSGENNTSHGIAVDLGTTTLVVALVSMEDGSVLDLCKEWNRQISFGSDVISRVKYTMDQEDGLAHLSALIRQQIYKMILSMLEKHHLTMESLAKIHVAGNTIMQHIFAEMDPSSIAVAPYIPRTLFEDGKAYYFDTFSQIPVYFLPCISGYVGGDIVSGIYETGLKDQSANSLFLDIGTNGEMAIASNGQIKTVSVASGPAFEGAEISCGMTGIPGAISHVEWLEHQCKINLSVIGDTIPSGLCGSGLIDLVSILIQTGYIDESGRLLHDKEAKKEIPRLTHARFKTCLGYKFLQDDEKGRSTFYLRRNPDVYLTGQDVRKLQLAKASVAAGIEFLRREDHKSYEEIDRVYLAGGFGEHITADSAARIGLIPQALKDKIISVGNTSLKGAIRSLRDEYAFDTMRNIIKKCEYTELSGNSFFSEEFIHQMNFEIE